MQIEGRHVFSHSFAHIIMHRFQIGNTTKYISVEGKRHRVCVGNRFFPLHFVANGRTEGVTPSGHNDGLGIHSDSYICGSSTVGPQLLGVLVEEHSVHNMVVDGSCSGTDSQPAHHVNESSIHNHLHDDTIDLNSHVPLDSEFISINALHSEGAAPSTNHIIVDDIIVVNGAPWSFSGTLPKTGEDLVAMSPFSGDFKGGSWNSQAMFAAECIPHARKARKAMALCRSHDFYCLQETHSQEGKVAAFTIPVGYVAFWIHGSPHRGGIAIVVNNHFLRLFNQVVPERDLTVVVPGRIAILSLRGPLGNLDIMCCYMDAHSSKARCIAMNKLANHIQPQSQTLSILTGDWNFVTDPHGRWSSVKEHWAQNGDDKDAKCFDLSLGNPYGFVEWDQEHFTCSGVRGAWGKLDRTYINQHLSHQMDRRCVSGVLNWCHKDVSSHRPTTFSRTTPSKQNSQTPLALWPFKHADFNQRLELEFNSTCAHHTQTHGTYPNPIMRSLMLKDAIKQVHSNILGENAVIEAKGVEDKLGWTLTCARALERLRFNRAEHSYSCYPSLSSLGKDPHISPSLLTPSNLASHLQAVQDHAIELAREDIANDIEVLKKANAEDTNGHNSNMKEQILTKLKRLSPGESLQLNCVQDAEGTLHSSSEQMAKALIDHWRTVFGHVPCNDSLLNSWFAELFDKKEDGSWNTGIPGCDDPRWKSLRKHMKKAIKFAKNSMPGPDGVPALAYKCAGDLAVDTLMGVLEVLSSPEAEATLTTAYEHMGLKHAHAFNESILCCLPKKPSGEDGTGGKFYKAEATRPLNISNMDNRLVASAVRMAWEPMLEKWISQIQRGFLRGRQMLHNIIDIDWESMRVSLKHPHGALILFDFKAAFPSVSHEFLIACLKNLGFPSSAMNFISSMYNNNYCNIKLGGEFFPGCKMLGGVRQGCPLSPLLFAVVVDILLRMLTRRLPTSFNRAFADDIGTIITNWYKDAPILEQMFTEFACISNLHLNISKTVCMPLWPKGLQEIPSSMNTLVPSWIGIEVNDKGTYLGFVLGPGKRSSSWDKPVKKYIDRVSKWRNLGCGLQFAVLSYNVFCISTLLFIGQLEAIPEYMLEIERKQVARMFPGPGGWLIPEDAWCFKECYGFHKSAKQLSHTVQAAQFRVAMVGCQFGRNTLSPHHLLNPPSDNIWSRRNELHACLNQSEFLCRNAHWFNWYEGCFCKVLASNLEALSQRGITPLSICKDITGKSPTDWDDDCVKKIKRQTQSRCLVAICSQTLKDPLSRIRHKIGRWIDKPFGLHGLPGHMTPLIHKHLLRLSKLVTPRVHAAVFKTLWNGWTSERRFQRRSKPSNVCKFQCRESTALGGPEDSIEHYCRCPVVMRVAQSFLHIHFDEQAALDIWTLNSQWVGGNPTVMTCVALLIYGAFKAFNSINHQGISNSQQAYICITQHCMQGALGHTASQQILDGCWRRPLLGCC